MDKSIIYSFMQKLFESLYGNGTIAARIRSKDDVLNIDTSFVFDHWDMSEDKQTITLYGEDDLKVEFKPQDLVRAEKDNDTFLFDARGMELAVDFI